MTTELCAYTCDACDIARRTGVTRIELCAAPFEGGTTPSAGLIRYARGRMGVIDRHGLEAASCECYHAARREFARLLGTGGAPPG